MPICALSRSSGAPEMTNKRAFTMQLFPEHFAEYCRRHDEIWPELTALLSNAGISDYSIFVDEAHATLYGTFTYRDPALLDALPAHPVMQRWWQYMAPLMATNPDNSPVQGQLTEIFRHDPSQRGSDDPFDTRVLRRVRDNPPAANATIAYSASNGEQREIEIFRPEGVDPAIVLPALVLFHGGGWTRGSPRDISRQAWLISQLGITVLAPYYAVTERDGSTPAQSLEDAFCAWDMICRNATELRIDPSRIAAGGSSAGGHLASALANLTPVSAPPALQPPTLLLLFEAVIDNGPGGYGHDRVADYWERFSPMHNVGESHPPTLLIAGEKDELLTPAMADAYAEKVRQTGAVCEVEVAPGAKHGWFQHEGFETAAKSALGFLARNFV